MVCLAEWSSFKSSFVTWTIFIPWIWDGGQWEFAPRMCPCLQSLCKGKPQGSRFWSHHCHQLLLHSEINPRRICLPGFTSIFPNENWGYTLGLGCGGSFLFLWIIFFNSLEKHNSCGNCKFLNLYDSYMKLNRHQFLFYSGLFWMYLFIPNCSTLLL